MVSFAVAHPPDSLGSPFVSDFLRSWLVVVVFGGLAVLLVSAFLGLGSLLRPSRETSQKVMNYESGVDPQGDMWSQSNIRYYDFVLTLAHITIEDVALSPAATRLRVYAHV